jgi:hypothetical protein
MDKTVQRLLQIVLGTGAAAGVVTFLAHLHL